MLDRVLDYFEVDRPLVLGAVLSLPGVPGQGVRTILVSLFLVDFPRPQQFERALARRTGVLRALNRLRVRFGRAPHRPPPQSQRSDPR